MELLEAVTATYAVAGQEISEIALKAIVTELQGYPPIAVLEALTRCRKELRKITLADILDRIPTGHPGVEEAWSVVSGLLANEDASVSWTDQMAKAFGVARHLSGDKIASRMAFKECYLAEVIEARDRKQGPTWRVSLGHDPHGRQAAIEDAVKRGRISLDHAKKLLPDFSSPAVTVALPEIRAMA